MHLRDEKIEMKLEMVNFLILQKFTVSENKLVLALEFPSDMGGCMCSKLSGESRELHSIKRELN